MTKVREGRGPKVVNRPASLVGRLHRRLRVQTQIRELDGGGAVSMT